MKKWILPALLIAVLIATFFPVTAAPTVNTQAAEPEITVNITLHGQPMAVEQAPILSDSVTLVPLRSIAEALGAEVTYSEQDQSITMLKGSTLINLALGSFSAQKNGQLITLQAAPKLVGNVTMVPARFISESFDMLVTWDDATRTVQINNLQELPAVGSLDNLKAIVQKAQTAHNNAYGMMAGSATTDSAMTKEVASAPSAAGSSKASVASEPSASADYSKTNTQVEGVDEADVVKTDGTYLYQVNEQSQSVLITQAYPSTEMKLVSTIAYKDQSFSPRELYVDDQYLVVIGSSYQPVNRPMPEPMPMPKPLPAPANSSSSVPSGPVTAPSMSVDSGAPAVQGSGSSDSSGQASASSSSAAVAPSVSKMAIASDRMIYPGYSRQTMKAYIYDISDKTKPKQVRDFELEGSYVSSRKIGSSLYLVANQYVNLPYVIQNKGAEADTGVQAQPQTAPLTPSYRDSSGVNEFKSLDYSVIRYFPDSIESNYMIVGGLDLSKPENQLNVAAYLGSGQNVFASDQNLYVAVTKYTASSASSPDPLAQESPNPVEKKRLIAPRYDENTTIYKFRLDQGATKFVAQGEVPGTVLNQFSMDEHNQHFRIATTKGQIWGSGENMSKNNVYVLNEAMNVTGKLENIAPGERIYSTRFMGNRAYMVTFKNVDPLFAIDMTNPANPTILGALKIPGYSDYLHPYDENHLIGFGKETMETTIKGGNGAPDQTNAYYLGMKISLFDVTNVAQPVEKFKEIIGDRGTYSELLNNHKALLFSKEHNLLSFPVHVMEAKNGTTDPNGMPAYGQFSFQGAYVYSFDLQTGFNLRATITHMTEEERLKASNNGWYGSNNHNVERILYIKDTLYTLSPGMIKTNDLLTLKEKDSLQLP